MKNLLICTLLASIFTGCATTNYALYNTKEEVFLDPAYNWVNNPTSDRGSDLRSITLRAVNNRYVAADVVVSCRFNTGDAFLNSRLFGTRMVRVDARDYVTFTVMGFREMSGFGSRIQCRIVSVS